MCHLPSQTTVNSAESSEFSQPVVLDVSTYIELVDLGEGNCERILLPDISIKEDPIDIENQSNSAITVILVIELESLAIRVIVIQ